MNGFDFVSGLILLAVVAVLVPDWWKEYKRERK